MPHYTINAELTITIPITVEAPTLGAAQDAFEKGDWDTYLDSTDTAIESWRMLRISQDAAPSEEQGTDEAREHYERYGRNSSAIQKPAEVLASPAAAKAFPS